MEMSKIFLFAFFLVYVAHGDDQAGFISIDCGIPDGSSYTDNTTTLNYVSDEAFINGAGIPQTILPIYQTNDLETQFLTIRSFPQGTRNCYALRPAQGKGNRYLIRARFLYGNYDSTNQNPQFELHLGADRWDTINITDSAIPVIKEIIHVPFSDYVYVCLVNIGLGTPFISVLELRLLNTSMYATEYGSLLTATRINFGSLYYNVRYNDDKYDRLWLDVSLVNSKTIYTFETVTSGFATTLELPTKVMGTAIEPKPATDSLQFLWDPRSDTHQIFIYMHLAEIEVLKPNQTREFNIYLNDNLWYPRPFSPFNFTSTTIYSTEPENISSSYIFTMNKTQKSTLPPIINALEIYKVKQLLQWQTDDQDAEAIWSTKSVYNITEDWQGDPCTPQAIVWNGLNCSYNGFHPPRIISLNLSSRGLTGQIARNLGNLTMLQTLDMSNNDLTGPIPDFLSQLTFLKVLNIRGNNFTGSVPAELLAKSSNKSLSLSADGRNMGGVTSSCLSDTCKSKKQNKFIIPVVASVASVSMVLFALAILWLVRSKTSQDGKRLVEMKNRHFTYSEVLNITNNFHKVIGKGGFGTVYHGYVSDVEVAVKMLSPSSIQGYKEFQAEATLLTSVHHKNLTSLVGYCNEGNHIAIIYEYMANGSLDRHLSATSPNPLSWEERLQISLDAAQGLEYLHHGCKQPIVHRDVKCTNILLNEKFQAKLADFGLSRAFPVEGGTHVSTVIAGTPGYLDPEYYTSNRLTEKSDVYSYGVVLLEIITSRPSITISDDPSDASHVSQWVSSMFAEGDVKSIVDSRLQGEFDIESVWKAVELALACVDRASSKRPTMNDVVMKLKDCLASERDRTRAQHETEADSVGAATLNLDGRTEIDEELISGWCVAVYTHFVWITVKPIGRSGGLKIISTNLFTATEMLHISLFVFLLCLAVNAQYDSSALSIDCGLPEDSNYTDAITGINYSSDASFISSGVRKTIPPLYQTNSLERQFLNLRSFPQGNRNCYILRPPQGKGHKYLIKASFFYGNYDNLDRLPTFDLHLGVGLWEKVSFSNASIPLKLDILHISSSDYIHVCLVKTSLSYPFISSLELRVMNSSLYTTQSGSLDLDTRGYFTTLPAPILRYKDDVYDRLWPPFNFFNSTTLHAASTIRTNEFRLPLIAMSSPNTPVTTSFLSFEYTPINVSDQIYFYFHFAEVIELQANESRKFDIYINGHRLNTRGPIVPAYLSASSVYSTSPETVSPIYVVSINQTRDSTLPPIINAFEIYRIRDFSQLETDDNDVDAMWSLKSTYGVIKNWQGDPCLPEAFVWDGVGCSYNGLDSPRIISLNLSASGLTGVIPPFIVNLTKIETLDLSYNNLTGAVPDLLTRLASLKVLNLKGNKLTGFVPAQLREKSRNGLLSMSIDPSNDNSSCQSVGCKKKKKSVVVPVLASVIGAVFVVLAVLGVVWMVRFRKRNQQESRSLSRKDSLARPEETDGDE